MDKQHRCQFIKSSNNRLSMKSKLIFGQTYIIAECLFYLVNGYIPKRLFIDENKHYHANYLLDFPDKYFYKRAERIQDIEYLKECFGLTEDGVLYFKQRPKCHFRSYGAWDRYNTRIKGKTEYDVDVFNRNNYKILCINAKTYMLHRIKYQLFINKLLNDFELIDHIDRDVSNNTIENLRIVDAFINAQNKIIQNIGKTSKYKGVCWDKSRGLFISKIMFNGKYKFLGSFACDRDAAITYDTFIENNNLETTTNKMLGLL